MPPHFPSGPHGFILLVACLLFSALGSFGPAFLPSAGGPEAEAPQEMQQAEKAAMREAVKEIRQQAAERARRQQAGR